jgi:site-specific recombinase XerD
MLIRRRLINGVEALERGHRSFQRRCAKTLVGHKNLETTQIYLGVTDSEKLRENINAAFELHP